MLSCTMALLRDVPLFAELDDPLLADLSQQVRRKTFRGNEALFHEGDEDQNTLFIILSGHVHIQRGTASGKTIVLASRGPGEYFGEMALIDGKPRMADAVTAEPCDLLILKRADFLRSIEQSPQIALGIMACLADRLREAAHVLVRRQELDVLGRVSEAVLELVKSHGVEEPGGGKRIDAPITHQQLADQIGATRESVSRALSGLKNVRAIRTDGRRLIVLNARKLRQYCAQ